MKMLLRATSCLAISLFVVCSANGQAATRTWVSGVGDDANPCSRTAPCLSLGGAIAKTAAGGEIDVLDPIDFGVVTITKAITIDGSVASVAGNAPSSLNGIIVNAGSSDIVVLRNLSLNGLNGSAGPGINGVNVLQAGAVHIEHCAIANFSTNGVTVTASSALELFIDDSNIHNNTTSGVSVTPSSATLVTINNTTLTSNGAGLAISGNTKATAMNVTATGNTGAGFQAAATSASASLNLVNSVSANNGGAGVSASGSGSNTAVVRLSNNSIYSNASGLVAGTNGDIFSYGDNNITGAGVPSGTLTKQ